MSDPVKLHRKIPLEGCVISYDGLIIGPKPPVGKVMLQRSNAVSDDDIAGLGQKFAQTFGAEFPLKVCDKTEHNDGTITVLCLNPTSWIILCDEKDVKIITEWLEDAAQGVTVTTSEMTDQYIILDIDGEHARSLLAKGCALDLSDKVFTKTHTARTLLAQANIIIWRNGEGGFTILFDVSLHDYLWCWLEGAAKEFAQG